MRLTIIFDTLGDCEEVKTVFKPRQKAGGKCVVGGCVPWLIAVLLLKVLV